MDQQNSPETPTEESMDNNGQIIIATQPVALVDRIKSIDAIRGFALLGILMMNIPGFGINWDFWYNIIHAPRSGWDFYTFAVIGVFFDGTMRGLFSMLFGAGMVLFMLNKKDVSGGPTVAEYYYRRLLWLVLFGVFNSFILLWGGDILFFYGLCGMILFAFRKLQPKYLVMLAVVSFSIGIFKNHWGWSHHRGLRLAHNEAVAAKAENKKLTEEQEGAITTWTEREKNQKPDTAEVNRNHRKMLSGYGTIFMYSIPLNAGFEVWFMYHKVWDMLTMMLLGMALFSWGFFTNKLRTSTYSMWLLIGYGIGIPIGWVIFDQGMMYAGPPGAYADQWRSSHFVYDEFRRVLLTIGHASLLMLVFRSHIVPWLMKALANVGQMAFTNYLMQSIICTWFFYGYGFGYYDKLKFYQLYYVVGIVWIFQILFSAIWMHYFRFGPFEWLWRTLTYWRLQPMRK